MHHKRRATSSENKVKTKNKNNMHNWQIDTLLHIGGDNSKIKSRQRQR